MVELPYNGMMHDFVVTQQHIVLYVTNMIGDMARMQAGICPVVYRLFAALAASRPLHHHLRHPAASIMATRGIRRMGQGSTRTRRPWSSVILNLSTKARPMITSSASDTITAS